MFGAATLLMPLLGVVGTLPPAPPCRVELIPGDAPRAWVAAASALRDVLRAGGPADRDCRKVVIRASSEQPSVEVTTLDGRQGVRRLADARDVEPTVTALIVTVLAAPPADMAASAGDVAGTGESPAPPTAHGWRALIVAGGGVRLTLPGTPAPVLELTLGVTHRSWEVGLFGAWAPTTLAIGESSPAVFSSTTEVGLGGARRTPIGVGDLFFGARASVLRITDADNGDSTGGGNNTDPSLAGVAPALTAVVGAAVPARAIVRLRPQLWFQWAPAVRLGGPNATSSVASIGIGLGAESRIP